VGGNFSCNENPQLRSLEGAPASVGGDFWCSYTPITSLAGAPERVGGGFWCHNTPITTLEGLPKTIADRIFLTYSSNLPLLRVLVAQGGVVFWSKGLRRQTGDAEKVAEIINRYAGQGRRGMFNAKKELIEAGFAANARW
jgi:hypothetical protein